MEKLNITKIYRTDTDKTGKKLVTRDGRDYERVAIKVKDRYEDKWISGFGNSRNQSWQEGDEIEVLVEKKDEYLNFSMLPQNVDYKDFMKLVGRVEALENRLNNTNSADMPDENTPDDDNDPF